MQVSEEANSQSPSGVLDEGKAPGKPIDFMGFDRQKYRKSGKQILPFLSAMSCVCINILIKVSYIKSFITDTIR